MENQLPRGFAARCASLADAEQIAEVINGESVESIGKPTASPETVRADLQQPAVDLSRDTRLVTVPDGTLAGFGVVYDMVPHVSLFVDCAVHPDHYGRGIGTALADWAEKRCGMSIILAPDDARVTVGQEIPGAHSRARELLRSRGYRPTRYFSRLQMALSDATPEPSVPAGIVIRPYGVTANLPEFVRAFDDAIRDHWGFVEAPFDVLLADFEAWIATTRWYDPELWYVAVAGKEVAGVAIGEAGMTEDAGLGYVNELAVRRPWRRQGIGTALLLTCLAEFRRRGFERAALDVDSESLTGATRLYERVGFRPVRQTVILEKELRPGRELRTMKART